MPEKPQSLKHRLKQRIRAGGPITVEAFMEAALTDPDDGYYTQRLPIGAVGDFITAPEICQIFGELIGLWIADVWRTMGAPNKFRLIELGPGRGTLMHDALRALAVVPDALKAAELHFVELSARLRAVQRATLADAPIALTWQNRFEDPPAGPAIIIANEFVDALPIRQLVRRKTGWHERCVGLANDDAFMFDESEAPLDNPEKLIPSNLRSAEIGSIIELRPAAEHLIAEIAARARMAATAALIIDYGHVRSAPGNTLQAVRKHRYADPLEHPGETDLTAQVDFAALADIAGTEGLAVYGPLSQGQFLLSLGLAERAKRLAAGATPHQAALLSSAAQRLVDPAQMGDLFKVLAIANGDRPPPPFT